MTRKAKRSTRNARSVNSDTCDADTTGVGCCEATCRRHTKCSSSSGTSSRRSRNGGSPICATYSRCSRSARKPPSAASATRSAFDAAITRQSTGIDSFAPSRSSVRSQDMQRRHTGNVAEASHALGISKKTLYHKLRQRPLSGHSHRARLFLSLLGVNTNSFR
ncbi:two-component system, NtrC family, C4-dicarboxylate transport response regulator DctD [Pandoraea sp. SD6-2]|nr:two-component system, NtrC family, C4-dicarboxylate transport response regulator DctD [Pandoraea sp. SD6-2]